MRVSIWNKKDALTLMNGNTYTAAQIMEMYPFTKVATILLEKTDEGITGGIGDFSIIRNDVYHIDPALSVEDAVAEVQRIKDTPPEPVPPPLEEADEVLNILLGVS